MALDMPFLSVSSVANHPVKAGNLGGAENMDWQGGHKDPSFDLHVTGIFFSIFVCCLIYVVCLHTIIVISLPLF